MTLSIRTLKPKLRFVDPQSIRHQGRPYILLRDPLALSPETILVPQSLAAVLPLLDGTRETAQVCASLAVRFGLRISQPAVDDLVEALDGAFLLDNARAAAAAENALENYRRAAYRPPALAGTTYPADPAELTDFLQGYMDLAGVTAADQSDSSMVVRGLVSPHIDYARGGTVYARVWQQAEEMARAADLVVILGTDHNAGSPTWTLTRQNFATPFGILPTDQAAVDLMAAELGEHRVFADELHHRQEHSIELAAVWLHFIRKGNPCSLVPILCGSFNEFIQGRSDPAADPILSRGIQLLRDYCAARQTLIVAAGDLAHVGPAFGGVPLDLVRRAQLKAADDVLMNQMCAGDYFGFYQSISQVSDRNSVCGLAPIYLALQLLGPAEGRRADYEVCPADEAGTSVVSVCGVVFETEKVKD